MWSFEVCFIIVVANLRKDKVKQLNVKGDRPALSALGWNDSAMLP